ncbi:MAG TPA: phage major capsid protein [Mucilaginibacter sp.]|jgi:hypothetical protein|nr:phage major capsid protein [Mucilaginibacter sp.]
MFKYKTNAELKAMTEAELDAYQVAKKAHEDDLNQKAIDKAVDQAKKDAKAEADLAIKAAVDAEKAEQKKITDDLNEKVNKLNEQTEAGSGAKDGIVVEFFKKNLAEKGDAILKADYKGDMKIKAAELMGYARKAAALMTTADVLPNVAGGFSPLFGNYIDYEIGHIPLPRMIFLNLITVINAPGTETIWFTDMVNEQGDAEFLAEGTLKPLVSAQWQTYSKPMKEVAEFWKQSKRLALHAPSVISDFAERANQYIEQKIDGAILVNEAADLGFDGLNDVGVPFIVPSTLANYYSFANIFDVIMACASQIMQANFSGELTAVLNTVWMAKMQGVKDSLGNYIVPPFVTKDGQNVGPVSVQFSNKVAATDITVGILTNYALVMAENISYDEGYVNDDFQKNLMSKKLEGFMGSKFKPSNSGSIIHDQIATILTAIEIPAV